MSRAAYNPHDPERPTRIVLVPKTISKPSFDRKPEALPPICIGNDCKIGRVTGLGCPGDANGCKLMADLYKPDPVMPKPPRV